MFIKLQKSQSGQRGFTVVEVLLAAAIITVLVVIILLAFSSNS